jgi:hypothetical protein
MSFLKLVFKPGINRDQTNYSGEGGWSDGDKIRFFSGYPQKLGGWQKTTSETFYRRVPPGLELDNVFYR